MICLRALLLAQALTLAAGQGALPTCTLTCSINSLPSVRRTGARNIGPQQQPAPHTALCLHSPRSPNPARPTGNSENGYTTTWAAPFNQIFESDINLEYM